LPQRAGDAVIGVEASALVFLSLVTTTGQALTLWCVGQAVAQGVVDKSVRTRLFNFGVTSVGGAALLQIVSAGRGFGRDVPQELAIVLLACAAYFLCDLIITAVSLSVEAGDPLWAALRWRDVPLPLVCFVGIDTLGYLGALLDRHQPAWTLVLLLVPIGTILVAVRAIDESRLAHGRLTRLFAATASAPDWGDVEQTERMLVEQAGLVLRRTEAALEDAPATGVQISSPLVVHGQPLRHLVVWPGTGRRKFDADDQGALDTLVAVAAAAMNRRRLADEMTHLARHDHLTGLANRRVFTDRLDHALTLRAEQRGTAILYCDLDGFKSVNDRLGHDVGDQLLTAVADRIQLCLRPGDTAARLGGDEFALLLEQVAPGGAESVAERVRHNLAVPFTVGGRMISVSASIGVAYVTDEQRAGDVLRHADTAMYRAKALGKDRAELFLPAMQADNLHRLQLEDELRQAVRRRSFTVAYQPVMDLVSGELEGYEALARWAHPDLGNVPPDVFIPLAEELGLIGEIGLHMLSAAFAGARELQARLDRRMTLAVNISPLQATDPKLLRSVRTHIAEHPDIQLVLELTELALLGDDQATAQALDLLVEAGAQLAVDDFGTGYSSISYLNRLPVSVLKIDRSFTCDLTDTRTLPLVQGVIAMAQAMGLQVIAEGIEDAATLATLRQLGCHSGQGFLFSRPLPLEPCLLALTDPPSLRAGFARLGG
jgi:diguanylate cyclase (GGDEF)-like protein